MVLDNSDKTQYELTQEKKLKEWDAVCKRCGACCGLAEGDPCEHLAKQDDGQYTCRIYENRLGMHKTLKGWPLKCISIREMAHTDWLKVLNCGYRYNTGGV